MLDYTIFYRSEFKGDAPIEGKWDLFVSAFNFSERVGHVFDKVSADEKIWIIHQEYQYDKAEWPNKGRVFSSASTNEADFFYEFFDALGERDFSAKRVCIDVTGFMRPHLMFLIKNLSLMMATKVDIIYTEPVRYTKREETQFSEGSIREVRQVAGFEGHANRDTSNDLLIIGAGYDHALIAEVAEHKDKADKIQIYGLPSLRADMYQENVVRAYRAADTVGEVPQSRRRRFFAPANDPFVTATVLSEIFARRSREKAITNLYLSPLATKPQALGFVLFYLGECSDKSASIIFPFSSGYSKETSRGVSRVWQYCLEFPLS
jgi:hypothetical protein